jgi:hypothetical protein
MERFGRVVALLALAAACGKLLLLDSGHPHALGVARIAFLIGFAALVFLRACFLVRRKNLLGEPLP